MRQFVIGMLMLISGMAGGIAAHSFLQKDTTHIFRYGKDLPEILYLVEQAYVDEVKMGKLMPGAFQGALEALDESASYIPPGPKPKDLTRALFLQTGLALTKRNGYPYILEVAADSPCALAGVTSANFIRGIDGASTHGKSLYAVQQSLLAKNQLKLSLLSPGKADNEEFSVTVKPFTLKPLSLTQPEPGTFVLQLAYEYPDLARDFEKACSGLPATATLVLDLRGNAIASMDFLQLLAHRFLDAGTLATWVSPQQKQIIENDEAGRFSGKLYVLQDHKTSAAAEIFCGAAREQGRARLVGESTIGLPVWFETIALKSGGYIHLPTRSLVLAGDKKLSDDGVQPHLKLSDEFLLRDTAQATLEGALTLIKNDDGRDDGQKKTETPTAEPPLE